MNTIYIITGYATEKISNKLQGQINFINFDENITPYWTNIFAFAYKFATINKAKEIFNILEKLNIENNLIQNIDYYNFNDFDTLYDVLNISTEGSVIKIIYDLIKLHDNKNLNYNIKIISLYNKKQNTVYQLNARITNDIYKIEN